jgi:hypothetical protein
VRQSCAFAPCGFRRVMHWSPFARGCSCTFEPSGNCTARGVCLSAASDLQSISFQRYGSDTTSNVLFGQNEYSMIVGTTVPFFPT